MTETLEPTTAAADGTAAVDWWSRLYDEMHADTAQHPAAAEDLAGKDDADDDGQDDAEDAQDDDPEARYEEFDDSDEPSPDDESDEPRQRVRELRERVREYAAGHRDADVRFRRLASATVLAVVAYATGLEHQAEVLLAEGIAGPAGAVALLVTTVTPLPLWRFVRRASGVLPLPAVSAPLVTLGGVYMASTCSSRLAVAGGHYIAAPVLGLLATGAVLCGAGWWIARRTAGWWAPLRWVCRLPLATAVLSLALYTPRLPAIVLPALHI